MSEVIPFRSSIYRDRGKARKHDLVHVVVLRSHTRDDLTFDASYDINRNAPFLSVGKRQNDKTALKVMRSLLCCSDSGALCGSFNMFDGEVHRTSLKFATIRVSVGGTVRLCLQGRSCAVRSRPPPQRGLAGSQVRYLNNRSDVTFTGNRMLDQPFRLDVW